MIHDNVSLRVSQTEATKVEEEAKRRLLTSKKLSLVVDLDQTIIHATVDPTVAEWQKDTDNPNYNAVKDVRAFQLVDDGPGARGCWYYIKLRPGLRDFLENVAKIYELHIYTMGTRAYAQNIASIIDPDRKIFGDRILSRDESGSLVAKNLQRLFPVDTKMVVIIDDRGDVWKWNENLIKVTPYDFFVGIGDINSSFLPNKSELRATPKVPEATVPDPNKDLPEGATKEEPKPKINGSSPDELYALDSVADNKVSALEQLVSMGGGDDPTTLQAQTSRQDETLAAQLQERPLLQKQKKLEAEEDAASEASKPKENGDNADAATDLDNSSYSNKPRHNLLRDDDIELHHLEQSLRKVHSEFFEAYARLLANAQGGRLAELRGSQSTKRKISPTANLDLAMVPDIKDIMPQIKMRALASVVIVFSGVVPLGMNIQNSDIALWAKNFGAKVDENVSKKTTHVIAARNRTAKVRQAIKRGRGRIKIVSTQWLMDSIVQWKKVEEGPYLLQIDEGESGHKGEGMEEEALSESEDLDSSGLTDSEKENGITRPQKLMPGPNLSIRTDDIAEEEDLEGVIPDELEDPNSPVGGTNEDWSHMQEELAEFLGSDVDDSETDSLASEESGKSGRSVRSKSSKRSNRKKRGYDAMSGGDREGKSETGSELQGRKKLAVGRSTMLSRTIMAGASASGLPTPEVTAEEDGAKEAINGVAGDDGHVSDGDGDGDGDGWSEFEGDLEAEMERTTSEENG